MTTAPPILEARQLSRVVLSNGKPRSIVDDISFSFQPGRIYSLLGPSGAGKSSLLRLFNRLDEPTTGEVFFEGTDYRTILPTDLRLRIGYLFQVPYMFRGTVTDNLRFANDQLDHDQCDRLLDQVSLNREIKEQSVEGLSVGEKQRIALARLLATDPKIVLLDEPTAALDPAYTDKIEASIKQIAVEKDLTVIMVSHDPQQALRLGGETLLIVAGRLVEFGPARELIEQPKTEEGRRYRDRLLT